jgi:hypothetical protein
MLNEGVCKKWLYVSYASDLSSVLEFYIIRLYGKIIKSQKNCKMLFLLNLSNTLVLSNYSLGYIKMKCTYMIL